MKGNCVSGDCFIDALRFRTCKKNGSEVISFPEVSRVLSFWRFRKPERDELLRTLEESGKIRIVNFKGIILEKRERRGKP